MRRIDRKLANHPQRDRVSFTRSGVVWRGEGRQTHYVNVGPRYMERCLGSISPTHNPTGWVLRIDAHSHVGARAITIPLYDEDFATLGAAKRAAREYLTRCLSSAASPTNDSSTG